VSVIRRNRLQAFLALWALGFLAFGAFTPRLGFYSDDWPLLETMAKGGRLGALGAWVREGSLWTRPFDMIQYSLFYFVGGAEPFAQHFLLFMLGLLEASLLFRLFDRLLKNRSLAWTAAALAYLYPNRAVFHVWFANTPQSTAHVLALASMLSHLRWLADRRPAWLASSLSLFLLALLSYESVLFLPLILMVAIMTDTRDPRTAVRAAVAACAPYSIPVILAMAWQWLGVRWLLGRANPKSQGLSLGLSHVLKAYGAGFECVTNRTVHLCFKTFQSMRDWPRPQLASCLAALVFVGAIVWGLRQSEKAGLREIRRALFLAASAFFAGYAPYALSGSYTPQIFGVMSRTNAIGAWAGGLLIAALLALSPANLRSVLTTLVLSIFFCGDFATDLDWQRAWQSEQEILARLAGAARELPPGSSVALAGAPHFQGYAVVFDSTYDFDAALRSAAGRADLKGYVVPPERNDSYRYDFSLDEWRPPTSGGKPGPAPPSDQRTHLKPGTFVP